MTAAVVETNTTGRETTGGDHYWQRPPLAEITTDRDCYWQRPLLAKTATGRDCYWQRPLLVETATGRASYVNEMSCNRDYSTQIGLA